MNDNGYVKTDIDDGVGTITFFHPKSNSLPAEILRKLAEAVKEMGESDDARVIVLRSDADRAFCAGASFDELLEIEDFAGGREFFMGFARLILAMRACPKFIIARVHGKAVGGGVGVAATADYSLALDTASAKLSELALGIGPFVVGPAVERKIGKSAFTTSAIDHDWRDAAWCKANGLYTDVFHTLENLDNAVKTTAKKLAACSPEAMSELKRVFFEGTDHWTELLESRAEISGRLIVTDFAKGYISQFKNKKK